MHSFNNKFVVDLVKYSTIHARANVSFISDALIIFHNLEYHFSSSQTFQFEWYKLRKKFSIQNYKYTCIFFLKNCVKIFLLYQFYHECFQLKLLCSGMVYPPLTNKY